MAQERGRRTYDSSVDMWALGVTVFYYSAPILTYYLLQNLLGYQVWNSQ